MYTNDNFFYCWNVVNHLLCLFFSVFHIFFFSFLLNSGNIMWIKWSFGPKYKKTQEAGIKSKNLKTLRMKILKEAPHEQWKVRKKSQHYCLSFKFEQCNTSCSKKKQVFSPGNLVLNLILIFNVIVIVK